jgi:hypothetical protein
VIDRGCVASAVAAGAAVAAQDGSRETLPAPAVTSRRGRAVMPTQRAHSPQDFEPPPLARSKRGSGIGRLGSSRARSSIPAASARISSKIMSTEIGSTVP